MYQTLVDCQVVHEHLANENWILVDCRFSLADTSAGQKAYKEAHIPGAVYAHLDRDLSGPPVTDQGRHPLPTPRALVALFGRLGIDNSKQVVAYDDSNGMVASRLWWMLRYMGHTAVAVLDGGWQAWQAADLPVRSGEETNPPAAFSGAPNNKWLVVADEVSQQPLLIDARSPVRYRGEEEPLDPKPGHIPGAVNFHFERNWTKDGRYLSAKQIRTQLAAILGDRSAEEAVFYCGSGVSACVNLLAMAHAGLGDGRLYVGSWSEWSRDPARPVVLGDE